MSDLLPCPFCDGKAVDNASAPLPYVYCESCDANGPTCDTLKGAFEHWNTRQALDALLKSEREKALSEAADFLKEQAADKGFTKTPAGRTALYYQRKILALIEKDKTDG